MDENSLIAECVAQQSLHDRVAVGSGDDCAVLIHDDRHSVISTDLLVEGAHFVRGWSTLHEIGARAAVQNMADVAAMGARQHSAVVGLAVPPDCGAMEIAELSAGFTETYQAHDGAVVGGDFTRGTALTIAVTVVGDLAGRKPILRSGAEVGDAVIFAGNLGMAFLGFVLYQTIDPGRTKCCESVAKELRKRGISSVTTPVLDQALRCYRVPDSPLSCAEQVDDHAGHALMDVSDGLSQDLGKIANASGVTVELDRATLLPWYQHLVRARDELIGIGLWQQVRATLEQYLGSTQTQTAASEREQPTAQSAEVTAAEEVLLWRLLLGGGEDHGFIGTCDPQHVPDGFTVIGRVKASERKTHRLKATGSEPKEGLASTHHRNVTSAGEGDRPLAHTRTTPAIRWSDGTTLTPTGWDHFSPRANG